MDSPVIRRTMQHLQLVAWQDRVVSVNILRRLQAEVRVGRVVELLDDADVLSILQQREPGAQLFIYVPSKSLCLVVKSSVRQSPTFEYNTYR